MSLPAVFLKTIKSLQTQPVLFLCLQLPSASTEVIETHLSGASIETSPFQALIWIPFFFFMSTLTTTLTYFAMVGVRDGREFSMSDFVKVLQEKWLVLLAAALLVGVICLAGFLALVLPGIYFTAMYLFVPQIVMDEANHKVMVSLNRSKALFKQAKLKTIFVVSIIFLSSIAVYFAGETIGTWLGGVLTHEGTFRTFTLILVKVLISLPVGALLDVFSSHYYWSLKGATQ